MAGVHLHLGHLVLRELELLLRGEQLGGELLAVALRAVAHRTELLELCNDLADAVLQLGARLRMPALHARVEQLRQRTAAATSTSPSRR